jgi:hypothetical protein
VTLGGGIDIEYVSPVLDGLALNNHLFSQFSYNIFSKSFGLYFFGKSFCIV